MVCGETNIHHLVHLHLAILRHGGILHRAYAQYSKLRLVDYWGKVSDPKAAQIGYRKGSAGYILHGYAAVADGLYERLRIPRDLGQSFFLASLYIRHYQPISLYYRETHVDVPVPYKHIVCKACVHIGEFRKRLSRDLHDDVVVAHAYATLLEP